MKVLKKGRPQKGWSGEFDCTGKGNGGGGCGAKLLVEYVDLYHTYHYDYTGDRDVYVTFTCGACGVENDIDYHGPNYAGIPDKRPADAGDARD